MFLKRCCLMFLLVAFAACSKDGLPKTYVFLEINKLATGDNVLFENTTAIWDSAGGHAELNASGYNLEHFKLKLYNITRTGVLPSVTLENIYYFEGNEYVPTSIEVATIEITGISSSAITGNFLVTFLSNYDLPYTISGRFEIIHK